MGRDRDGGGKGSGFVPLHVMYMYVLGRWRGGGEVLGEREGRGDVLGEMEGRGRGCVPLHTRCIDIFNVWRESKIPESSNNISEYLPATFLCMPTHSCPPTHACLANNISEYLPATCLCMPAHSCPPTHACLALQSCLLENQLLMVVLCLASLGKAHNLL